MVVPRVYLYNKLFTGTCHVHIFNGFWLSQNNNPVALQIGPIQTGSGSQIDFGYPTIRWHQMMDDSFGMPMKNTFMAVAMDLTDPVSPYGQ